MTIENYIKAELVRVAIADAYSVGGVQAMLAVAHVYRNRVDAGWSGASWLHILRLADEVRGNPLAPAVEVDWSGTTFRSLLRRIEDVYHNTAEDLSNGGLYYATLADPVTPWFQHNILDQQDAHPRCADVGGIYFFG